MANPIESLAKEG